MSKNSEAILNIIRSTDEHLTAEQIFMRVKEGLPGIALSTVYNNLNALLRSNRIRKLSVQGMTDVYDKAEIRHDHLVCDRCGELSDIVLENFTAKLERETGIHVQSYDLNIHYICDKCQKRGM